MAVATTFGRLAFADWLQLFVFSAMSVTYALYMAELLPQSIYFGFLIATVGLVSWRIVLRLSVKGGKSSLAFGGSALAMLAAAALLVAITVFRESAVTGTVSSTSFLEAFYIAGPVLIALGVANTSSLELADIYMTVLLARYVLYFLLTFDLNFASIASINWTDSGSSQYESSFAHDLLVLECYFLYRGLRGRASLALVFTLLAFKRASFLLAPVVFLAGRRLRAARAPSRGALIALCVIGIVSPFAIMWAYSDSVANGFESLFGIDLNAFVSGRETIYDIANSALPGVLGFGWMNAELSRLSFEVFGTSWNGLLHNDTLRLYLEVGVFGLAAYVVALVWMARWSRMSLVLVSYTLFVLITSRLITSMSFWIVLFLALALIERDVRARQGADQTDARETGNTQAPNRHRII